jgi:hypothetical protein
MSHHGRRTLRSARRIGGAWPTWAAPEPAIVADLVEADILGRSSGRRQQYDGPGGAWRHYRRAPNASTTRDAAIRRPERRASRGLTALPQTPGAKRMPPTATGTAALPQPGLSVFIDQPTRCLRVGHLTDGQAGGPPTASGITGVRRGCRMTALDPRPRHRVGCAVSPCAYGRRRVPGAA